MRVPWVAVGLALSCYLMQFQLEVLLACDARSCSDRRSVFGRGVLHVLDGSANGRVRAAFGAREQKICLAGHAERCGYCQMLVVHGVRYSRHVLGVSGEWHGMSRWCWDVLCVRAWPYEDEDGRNRDETTRQSQEPEGHESTRLWEQDEAMISVMAVVVCVLWSKRTRC